MDTVHCIHCASHRPDKCVSHISGAYVDHVCWVSGGISWGRLGSSDHTFSLPITPTAHMGQRAFAPPSHGSRLSHVSRADSMGYAARHSMLESQNTIGRMSSGLPFSPGATHAFSRSGRHSTPLPSHTSSKSTGRNSSKAKRRGCDVGSSLTFDLAETLSEAKPYAHGSVTHVTVDASSSVGISGVSSLARNESSYRSSSSSSQEDESHGSIPPQLRIISLDQESGRIFSAESPRGSSRVLAWHPSSTGGGIDSQSVTSERSATSTGALLQSIECLLVQKTMHGSDDCADNRAA